jgi:hypothetical protein
MQQSGRRNQTHRRHLPASQSQVAQPFRQPITSCAAFSVSQSQVVQPFRQPITSYKVFSPANHKLRILFVSQSLYLTFI